MKILTFALDDSCYGIPLENVEFVRPIESRTDIKSTAATSRHMKGYILFHGRSVQVYSLSSLLGFPEREIRQLVVINVNGMRLGLGVDWVEAVIDVKEEDALPVPVCANTPRSYLRNIVEYDQKQLILLVDVHKLVSYGGDR